MRSSGLRSSVRHLSNKSNAPTNAFGIRLLPDRLRRQLFPLRAKTASESTLKEAQARLASFGLGQTESSESNNAQSDVTDRLELPELIGGDIEQHFKAIGHKMVQPYIEPLLKWIDSDRIPPMPDSWLFEAGWRRYVRHKDEWVVSESAPLEPVITFDVEVCVKEGPAPVMATALSEEAWYAWISPHLVHKTSISSPTITNDLIQMGDNSSLVIGHNVSYDRARIADEYCLKSSSRRFLDTMALHIVVSGMTSGQRMLAIKAKNEEESEGRTYPAWLRRTSLNNLRDVFKLYCPSEVAMDKQKRDIFVTGDSDQVRSNFQELVQYCANDTLATFKLAAKLVPIFRQRCPHPVTLAGMLEMGSGYLPLSPDWPSYVSRCESVATETEALVERLIEQQAKEACQLLINEQHKRDPWLWDQDWSTRELRVRKNRKQGLKVDEPPQELLENIEDSEQELSLLEHHFSGLLASQEDLFKVQPSCPGYPKWYEDLRRKKKTKKKDSSAEEVLGPTLKIVPKLLRLTWRGYPLHRHQEHKWGFLVPDITNEDDDITNFDEDLLDDEESTPRFPTSSLLRRLNSSSNDVEPIDSPHDVPASLGFKKDNKNVMASEEGIRLPEAPDCLFYRLPHKDGPENRVGNPLAKDFLSRISEGTLAASTSNELGFRVLESAKRVSYWKSNRDRILNQMVVKTADGRLVILPQMVTAGTLTRRAVERTWLTASNAKTDRIGSELKSLVRAPENHHLVGADVDSQELWIASVLGDSVLCQEHGATPLGWMTLQGSKKMGTDMHSMTARTAGVSRDEAKVLNYGRIYGAGEPFAKQLLARFNPALTLSEAGVIAKKMYEQTKGVRVYLLNDFGQELNSILNMATNENFDYDNKLQKQECVRVSRKQMGRLVRLKRQLDPFLHRESSNKWRIKDEESSGQLLVQCLDINMDQEMSNAQVASLLPHLRVNSYNTDFDLQSWQKDVRALCLSTEWTGGTESVSFNAMERIAQANFAKTPVLECRISRALESFLVGEDFLPSRINWVVQSSAVDYLHLLLVATKWMMEKRGIEGRFVISIHDEVRYLVRSEQRYEAAFCLQVANLMVRAMFSARLGMSNVPESVAFFSAVDVDLVMRKDPNNDCVTPSNPLGLRAGQGVDRGEELDIKDILHRIRAIV